MSTPKRNWIFVTIAIILPVVFALKLNIRTAGRANTSEVILSGIGQTNPPPIVFSSLSTALQWRPRDHGIKQNASAIMWSLQPPGSTFPIHEPIMLGGTSSKYLLQGNDATLVWASTAAGGALVQFLTASSVWRLTNMTLRCSNLSAGIVSIANATDISLSTMRILGVGQQTSGAITFTANTDVLQQGIAVRDIYVESQGFGVLILSRSGTSRDHVFERVFINGSYGHALLFSGISNGTITSCTTVNVNANRPATPVGGDGRFGHGVAVDGNSGHDPVYTLRVHNNTVINVSGYAGERYRFEGIEVGDAVYNATITNNTIISVAYGYGVYFGGGNFPSANAVISDNIIRDVNDYGIYIDGRNLNHAPTTDVTVKRNRIYNAGPAGILTHHAARITVLDRNQLFRSGSFAGVAVPPGCINCSCAPGQSWHGPAPKSIWPGPPPTGSGIGVIDLSVVSMCVVALVCDSETENEMCQKCFRKYEVCV